MRGVACIWVAVAVAGWAGGRADPPAAKPYGTSRPGFVQSPATSCSASACHGNGQVGQVGGEHTTWAPDVQPAGPHDPHARAYRVLFNADSVRIAKLLGRGPAHTDELCLKCHAVDGVKPGPAAVEGVGCGACHGPAEKWLAEHSRPGWKGLSHRQKFEAFGFVPTKSLVARVLNCAGCHVGDANREVNHDLIAAGHPRLNFEYTRFHYQPHYRHHWTEPTPQPDLEVRAWVVGQAASLRAAVELLRVRAERAVKPSSNTPWPEFAGFSCYSCHQSIGTGEPKGSPRGGRPGWELWYSAAIDVAADSSGEVLPGVRRPALTAFHDLRKAMNGTTNPNPRNIADHAAAAVAELDAWLADLQAAEDRPGTRLDPGVPRTVLHRLAGSALDADRTKLRDADWDFLSAHYLGCAAMFHAGGGSAGHPEWAGPVTAIRVSLRFPAEFRTPKRDAVRNGFLSLLPGGNR